MARATKQNGDLAVPVRETTLLDGYVRCKNVEVRFQSFRGAIVVRRPRQFWPEFVNWP